MSKNYKGHKVSITHKLILKNKTLKEVKSEPKKCFRFFTFFLD